MFITSVFLVLAASRCPFAAVSRRSVLFYKVCSIHNRLAHIEAPVVLWVLAAVCRLERQYQAAKDRALLLSRKLFENVSSLFANESEFVIIGMHLTRQLDTGKVAWPSRSGSFQEVQSAGGNGGS